MSDTSLTRLTRPWLRSMLFVPTHKAEWVNKAPSHGADAIILDLEDSVPPNLKADARAVARNALDGALAGCKVFVRVNEWKRGLLLDDVVAVAHKGLTGIVLPKVATPQDIEALDLLLCELEQRESIPTGEIEIVPVFETARSVEYAFQILKSSKRIARVPAIAGLTPGAQGDLHHALGVEATLGGEEMLFSSSRIVAAARASGIRHVLGGMAVDLNDDQLVRASLMRAKQHGATGSMAIHPSHLAVIHEVFTPNTSQVQRAQGMLRAMAIALADGSSAARFDGVMIDIAHARAAAEVVTHAVSCGVCNDRDSEILALQWMADDGEGDDGF